MYAECISDVRTGLHDTLPDRRRCDRTPLGRRNRIDPHVPVSHPFVERLIGMIRREFLDHALIWNAVDLERKLEEFRTYYNGHLVTSRSMVALRENVLASRRPPLLLPATRGRTNTAVYSNDDRGMTYEFASTR
ncbi:MAG: integrase core domain-containing protein [Sphingomonadaceae bacterium]